MRLASNGSLITKCLNESVEAMLGTVAVTGKVTWLSVFRPLAATSTPLDGASTTVFFG